MHSRLTLALGVAGASLAFAGPALAATPTPPSEYVSTSGSDTNSNGSANTCRLSSNPCQTIQHAINVAPTTGPATIKVGQGTFPEQLTIANKAITIVGQGASVTTIAPTSLPATSNDPNNASAPLAPIVSFTGAASGGLTNVTVNGANSTQASCSTDYTGVYLDDSTATLSGDTVTNIASNPTCQPGGPDGGVYVANDDATTGATGSYTATMNSLTVNKYGDNGITCEDVDTSCVVSGTTVTGAGATSNEVQNGVVFEGTTAGTVKNSTITKNTYDSASDPAPGSAFDHASGISAINTGTLSLTGNSVQSNDVDIDGVEDQTDYMPAGPTQGLWTISGNSVTNATNATSGSSNPVGLGGGIGDGIDLYAPTGVNVYKNTVTGNADWGIALFGVTNSNIGASHEGNIVSNNADDGIYVGEYTTSQPSTGDTVAYNTSSVNGHDGILAGGNDANGNPESTGNTFTHNTLQNDVNYDAEDQSTGTGTAGTANAWSLDHCTPSGDSNPSGLCAS